MRGEDDDGAGLGEGGDGEAQGCEGGVGGVAGGRDGVGAADAEEVDWWSGGMVRVVENVMMSRMSVLKCVVQEFNRIARVDGFKYLGRGPIGRIE